MKKTLINLLISCNLCSYALYTNATEKKTLTPLQKTILRAQQRDIEKSKQKQNIAPTTTSIPQQKKSGRKIRQSIHDIVVYIETIGIHSNWTPEIQKKYSVNQTEYTETITQMIEPMLTDLSEEEIAGLDHAQEAIKALSTIAYNMNMLIQNPPKNAKTQIAQLSQKIPNISTANLPPTKNISNTEYFINAALHTIVLNIQLIGRYTHWTTTNTNLYNITGEIYINTLVDILTPLFSTAEEKDIEALENLKKKLFSLTNKINTINDTIKNSEKEKETVQKTPILSKENLDTIKTIITNIASIGKITNWPSDIQKTYQYSPDTYKKELTSILKVAFENASPRKEFALTQAGIKISEICNFLYYINETIKNPKLKNKNFKIAQFKKDIQNISPVKIKREGKKIPMGQGLRVAISNRSKAESIEHIVDGLEKIGVMTEWPIPIRRKYVLRKTVYTEKLINDVLAPLFSDVDPEILSSISEKIIALEQKIVQINETIEQSKETESLLHTMIPAERKKIEAQPSKVPILDTIESDFITAVQNLPGGAALVIDLYNRLRTLSETND
ncbi:MAG TPA: hypothetical protein VEK38_03345 [Candidatus Bathyarchaeia archaeon]|nr:hypothetical protein [Candidatus Bathyarchaeia archaeon]